MTIKGKPFGVYSQCCTLLFLIKNNLTINSIDIFPTLVYYLNTGLGALSKGDITMPDYTKAIELIEEYNAKIIPLIEEFNDKIQAAYKDADYVPHSTSIAPVSAQFRVKSFSLEDPCEHDWISDNVHFRRKSFGERVAITESINIPRVTQS